MRGCCEALGRLRDQSLAGFVALSCDQVVEVRFQTPQGREQGVRVHSQFAGEDRKFEVEHAANLGLDLGDGDTVKGMQPEPVRTDFP